MGERKWKRREFERDGEKVEKERVLNWWGGRKGKGGGRVERK